MASESEFIRRYKEVFTREECNKIIEYIEFFESNNIISYDREHLHMEDHKTVNVTHDYDYDFVATSRLATMIMPKFKPCIDEYLETFSVLGQRKFLVHDLKLKKIPSGGGFHSWHYENGALSVSPRQFVVQVYLNDEFDGGETEFLYQQRREKALTGDLLIFPASFTHTHRGNPPLGGVKYIATTWGMIQDDSSN